MAQNEFKFGGVYTAEGDLSKKWFLWYYFLHPKTSKWTRFTETCDVNRIKNRKRREYELRKFYQARCELLEEGWNPFTRKMPEVIEEEPSKAPSITKLLELTLENRKGLYAKKTHQTYQSRLKHFIAYLEAYKLSELPAPEIGRNNILQFMEHAQTVTGLSYNYVTNCYETLHMLFDDLLEEDHISKNPCKRIKRSEIESTAFTAYIDHETKLIFDYALEHKYNLYLVISLIYYDGLRPKEIRFLKVKDINLKKKLISPPGSISKNKKYQSIVIYPKLELILMEYLKTNNNSENYLITLDKMPGKNHVSANYFQNQFKKIRKELGFNSDKKLYAFKHTSAEELMDAGANAYDVQLHFRHSDVKLVIDKYARGRGKLPTQNLEEKMKALK